MTSGQLKDDSLYNSAYMDPSRNEPYDSMEDVVGNEETSDSISVDEEDFGEDIDLGNVPPGVPIGSQTKKDFIVE